MMIMDYALQLNFCALQLQQINSCCVYLQVLTISDIATASGTHLSPHILKGRRDPDRHSTLHWPNTRRPKIWAPWKLFLQHISSGTKLEQRLGSWIKQPHQQWQWFYNPTSDIIYHRKGIDEWYQYEHMPQRQLTRLQNKHYNNPILIQTPSIISCPPDNGHQKRERNTVRTQCVCLPYQPTIRTPATMGSHSSTYASSQYTILLPTPDR
jgi:hypothetical protein